MLRADLNTRMGTPIVASWSMWAQVLNLARSSPTARAAALTQEEFSRLYEASFQTLVVVAISQTGRAHAEDVVQQAALLAWERRAKFEVGTDFAAWLAAIVRGVARNHRRGEKRRDSRHQQLAHEPAHSPTRQTPDDADSYGLGNGQDGQSDPALHTTLDQLSERQRECFLLRVLLDKTYDQIATVMDLPAATARTHVFRARQQLADALGESQQGSKAVDDA